MNDEAAVKKIFFKALESVDPVSLVKGYASRIKSYYSVKNFRDLYVIGFGKAACQMAFAVEEIFGPEMITEGVVVTKYGHADSEYMKDVHQDADLKKIRLYEAAHPVPDENGIRAAEEIIKTLRKADQYSLVLCLVSGGGSALLVCPYDGMTLDDKQSVTNLLLRAGADIAELNSVRKHLSKIKGGRLAEIARPAETIAIMISDVIGDDIDVIASGPTAPDRSTYNDAWRVIEKYSLVESIPTHVSDILQKGVAGELPDTPKPDDPVFRSVQNVVVGSNQKALEAAHAEATQLGFEVEILSSEVTGEARDVGRLLASKVKDLRSSDRGLPLCLVSGGETTVTVTGEGKGGRNTELALSFAMEIEGVEGVTLLSAGTDGNDGPTDATGAIVDGDTVRRAREMGLDPQEYLNNNDSYNFFHETDSLLITGPTGTNVMDVQILLVR